MTASQMADGSHTFRIRLVDEVNREIIFYRVRLSSRSGAYKTSDLFLSRLRVLSVRNRTTMRRHHGLHDGGNLTRSTCRILLLATLMSMAAMYAQSAHDSDSARVLALETLWNQAEVAKDASALDHLLAENFTFVDIDGSLKNKAECLD